MRQSISLIWKEWHETRAFLWIAIGIFIGLPVIRGVEAIFQHWRRFEVSTSPWVLAFGGVLAVFVAVGATCRDFNGHLDDFWRSRPVSATRWMLIKYLVGLVVVLVSCVLPLIVEFGIDRGMDAPRLAVPLIVCFPFIWTVLYSVGFLSGCVVRRTAHAAMLGLAVMLLVNFLPMVLPPLHWLDVSAIAPTTLPILHFAGRSSPPGMLMRLFGPLLKFAGGMLGIAIVALSLALLAVQRGWRIDSGRKMMYGSVSAVLLILVSSAAFQLGTSLPILQQVEMPNAEQIIQLVFDGRRGYAISRLMDEQHRSDLSPRYSYRTVELTASGIKLGEPIESSSPLVWGETNAPEQPEISYWVNEYPGSGATSTLMLFTTDVRSSYHVYSQQPLWEQRDNHSLPTIYAWKDRLYVIGTHLVTLDISLPSEPRVISNTPFQEYSSADYEYDGTTRPTNPSTVSNNPFKNEMLSYFSGGDRMLLPLPQVPGLPPKQKLEAQLKILSRWGPNSCEGDIVCTMTLDGSLLAYRLTKLTGSAAVLEKIGEHDLTTIEGVFGLHQLTSDGMKLQNGLLYVTYASSSWVSFAQEHKLINSSISVFDTHGSPPMRLIAHFAAPDVATVAPMLDGRALVGGDKLWLVGPPPHRGAD